jgi:hypothetical protein
MPALKRAILSPLAIVMPVVLLLFVYINSVLTSNALDDFDYGIHYARAQAHYGYWTQARADEMIQRSLAAFVPSFLAPVVIIAALAVTFLIIQRRLRLRTGP